MKTKTFFKLMISLMLAFTLSSCSSDDNDEVEKETKTLVGTNWEETRDNIVTIVSFYDTTSTLTMRSLTSGVTITTSYEYVYNHPKVMMNPNESGVAVLEGTVSYNTMTLRNTSTNKTIATLNKK